MKSLLIILGIVVLFSSCKKCATCDVIVTQTQNGQTTGSATVNTEVCGTARDIEDAEKAGNYTTTAHSGNITITQITKTTCY